MQPGAIPTQQPVPRAGDKPFPFARPPELNGNVPLHDVVIIGAGPVGLTLAHALAAQGLAPIVLEKADCVGAGSKALGMSGRTMEIWDAIGVADAVRARGLVWDRGTSFYRGKAILDYRMDWDRSAKFPPMTNLQQDEADLLLAEAFIARGRGELRWLSECTAIANEKDHVHLGVSTPEGTYELRARYAVACDGGRSFARSALGCRLHGDSLPARFVIVDIALDSDLEPGRRAWFDPVANPGSSILMHRQPGNIWRLDYQVPQSQSLEEAIQPDAIRAFVQTHLDMLGETGHWDLVWSSSYQARGMTLDDYVCGRTIFAGDAAHLTPIFGIRGLNSGVEDAWTLGWILPRLLDGRAGEALLRAYSLERVAAARTNIDLGSRSAEIMAPSSRARRLVRDAVLSLALDAPEFGRELTPRQGSAARIIGSPLNGMDDLAPDDRTFVTVGDVVPNLKVVTSDGAERHLHDLLLPYRFTLLTVSQEGPPEPLASMHLGDDPVPVLRVSATSTHDGIDAVVPGIAKYMRQGREVWLIRPDHIIAAKWNRASAEAIAAALRQAQPADDGEKAI